jgi:L-ascorbate metabolism protein UlaG (beta-lactamase superfamily)
MLGTAMRFLVGTAAVAASGWVLRALHDAPAAVGAGPDAIHAVARRSSRYRDGVFDNIDPASPIVLRREERRMMLRELVGIHGDTRPGAPIPLVASAGAPSSASLTAHWYGHSTALVEIDGYRVLTDPIWSRRCSPSRVLGPQRMHDVPVELEALPAVDAVVISHDHYDHLDFDTIVALARSQRAPFVVPLGVGAHLRAWGIPDRHIVELDWNESHSIGELTLVCTPARHFSGRLLTRNTTLWASWVLAGPRHRVYFAGDTGYTRSFAEIGSDHGPFDLTLLPIGAYNRAWPDIHMNPEEAVRAHRDLAGDLGGQLLPIHWATFRLAPHPWSEPIERLVAAAGPAGVSLALPRPGQLVEVGAQTPFDPWWRP